MREGEKHFGSCMYAYVRRIFLKVVVAVVFVAVAAVVVVVVVVVSDTHYLTFIFNHFTPYDVI